MPRMGIGMPLVATATEAAVLTIDDFVWKIISDGVLNPLDTSGTLNDTSDVWDYDGTNIMPEASPDSEGVWERGPNLIANHNFAVDASWSKTGSASISEASEAGESRGKATVSGSDGTSLLFQGNLLVKGTAYELVYTISSFSRSSGTTDIINNDGSTIQEISANGTFTFIFTHAIDNSNLLFRATNGTNTYQLDNVVLKEYAITPLDV